MNSRNVFSLKKLFKSPLFYSFLIPFFYWMYLLATTRMVIVFDGKTYQTISRIIYEHGWAEFLRTGPHNEPLYPLIISTSMHLADHLPCSYQKILNFIQIIILACTQFLAMLLFNKLNIKKSIIALTLFYIGVSPALVNAAFSHWSEIVALPWIIGIILVSVNAWTAVQQNNHKQTLMLSLLLSFLFIGITSVKAIFEFVFYIYMLAFVFLMLYSVIKQQKFISTAVIFCLITFSCFGAFLFTYKSLNQKYNGHFMLADRGPYIMYGNVTKRTEPLSTQSFLASVAFIAGDGICYALFPSNVCQYWELTQVDAFGHGKLNELKAQGLPPDQLDKTLLHLAKEKIMRHPFQYFTLTFLEGFKAFFWESTKVGYVIYPGWLMNLFDCTLFKNTLRFIVSLGTIVGFFMTLMYIFHHKNKLITHQKENEPLITLFFMSLLIMAFIMFYSLFYIHTRYLFPIAVLYLSMIAFHVQRWVKL